MEYRNFAVYQELMRPEAPVDLLEALTKRPAWPQRAACRGQITKFFPESGHKSDGAKQICATCPVFDECAGYAADNPKLESGAPLEGVWAGSTKRERRLAQKSSAA